MGLKKGNHNVGMDSDLKRSGPKVGMDKGRLKNCAGGPTYLRAIRMHFLGLTRHNSMLQRNATAIAIEKCSKKSHIQFEVHLKNCAGYPLS